MKQTSELDNACGVIACLHSVYNNVSPDKITLVAGSVLDTFHSTVKDLSPADKASSLENYNDFKTEYRKVAS